MTEKEQYVALISEIIKKQSVILGPEIAILKARSVSGLIVKNALGSIFAKYPELNISK